MLSSNEPGWARGLAVLVLSAFFIGVAYPSQTGIIQLFGAIFVGAAANYALLPLLNMNRYRGEPLKDNLMRITLLLIRITLLGLFLFWVTPTTSASLVELATGLVGGVLIYCLAATGIDIWNQVEPLGK